jgi:DNA topoisomerase-2
MIANTNTDSNDLFFDVQMKTDKQHILELPDTYIGSIERSDDDLWIVNEEGDKIIRKNISYIPGLFKLFDEGIVNCRDHAIRMQQKINEQIPNSLPVTQIEIEISPDGSIVMSNNGNGIDIAKHPEYDLWIPEMIFGHLRTSTNYNKNEKKITGGKNGFGVKLLLIWSTYGRIETVDHIRGLKYVQDFHNNLDVISPPKITKFTGKPYTKIIFRPDYQRFGIEGLTPDIINLLKKRVYDISAVTDKSVKVKYNGNQVPIKNFEQYIDMYIGNKEICKRVYESNENGRWEYAVALTPTNEFTHISFVNGIHTFKGGKHVEYIINQITRKLVELIEKKKKIKVNPNTIKDQIILFLRCDIENPTFDGQIKEHMKTPPTNFGSRCEVSDKFIEKIAKLGIMETVCAITEIKEHRAAKRSDGSKIRVISGIPKLIDANWAGTDKSHKCILIITEGDSAKTGVVSGLSSEHRNYIGIYPIKGKLPNVRGMTFKNILENDEISDIKKILGLEIKKNYSTIEDVHRNLRYSKIMFTTDQDPDGSHIKGLGINLFQSEWPSLYRIPGFISFMNTPILKATKNGRQLSFYNNGEYEEWKQNNETNGWKIKYYKGLGTSTKVEFKEYFENPKMVNFIYSGSECDDAIDMAFNKKRAEDRKHWLENTYDRNSYLDTRENDVSYTDFTHKELIHFSKYDCDRSIPNLIDGLKISTRKIIYSAFKKNLINSIKVAQFTGYVSEQSGYHHGEESLNKAIVGLAQNYVGSNNINLLTPEGQFGSRMLLGKDSASPRYIFTKLERITRFIYPSYDDDILNYLDDDGTIVEPQFYVPILPMILINGSSGIGTGFSSDVLCYNPRDIIAYLKNKLSGQSQLNEGFEFIPYYDGFTGTITKLTQNKILFKGTYTKTKDDEIIVTELPISMSIQKFKELLDKLQNDKDDEGKRITPIIKEIRDNCTESTIYFTITFSSGKLKELEEIVLEHGCNGLEKTLKLFTTETTTNMNLFNSEDKLVKYNSIPDIIEDYYLTRLHYYHLRKDNLIAKLERELKILRNKSLYIREILNDTIDLRRKSEKEVNDMLMEHSYETIDDNYNYLTDMKMSSVCNENVNYLNNKYLEKENELEKLTNTTIENIWLTELQTLEVEYERYVQAKKEENYDQKQTASKVQKQRKPKVTNKLTNKSTDEITNKVTDEITNKVTNETTDKKKTTKKTKETQSKEKQPKKTQTKETQPKETQPKETQPKKTQTKETQAKETQPKETQSKETQPKEITKKIIKVRWEEDDEEDEEEDDEEEEIHLSVKKVSPQFEMQEEKYKSDSDCET